jgi:hypothetical protein
MAKLLNFPLIRVFIVEKLHKSHTIYVILAFVRLQSVVKKKHQYSILRIVTFALKYIS